MSREARSFAVMEYTASPYVYKDADTYVALVAMLQQVMSTRVSQAALVMVTLSYDQDLKPAQALQNDRSTISILQYLRSLVRKTDYVVRLASTCYFLLPGADEHSGQIVQTRLWEALLWRTHSASEGEIIRPRGMAIGHSSYPTPCLTVEALLEKASDAALRFDSTPEKATRKPTARQQQAKEPELSALARKLGVPYLSLLPRKSLENMQQLVNPRLAQELHCYPLGRERNILTVAISDPQNRSALDRLQQETGLLIFPVLTNPQELQTALDQLS